MFDVKEFNLNFPIIYGPELQQANQLLDANGFTAVPTARFRAVDVGGHVQIPPADADDKSKVQHWMAVYKGVAETLARELLQRQLIEIRQAPSENGPDFVHLIFRVLTVIPQGSKAPVSVGQPVKSEINHNTNIDMNGANIPTNDNKS